MAINGLRLSYVNPSTVECGPGSCTTNSGAVLTVEHSLSVQVGPTTQNVAWAVWLVGGEQLSLVLHSSFDSAPGGAADARRIGIAYQVARGNLLRFTQTGSGEARTYEFAGSTRPRVLSFAKANKWKGVPRSWLLPKVVTQLEVEAELIPYPGVPTQGVVRGVEDPNEQLDISSSGFGVDSFKAGHGSDMLEFISPDSDMKIILLGLSDSL